MKEFVTTAELLTVEREVEVDVAIRPAAVTGIDQERS